jgi:hypothetical protein
MKNKVYRSATLAILCLLPLINASAQQPSQPASAQNNATEILVTGQHNASQWFRAESQHFIVFSDTSHEDTTQLLNNLEHLDYLLRIYTQTENKPNANQKLTLYYAERIDDLKKVNDNQPFYAVGFYNSCALGVQGFGAQLNRLETTNDDLLKKHPLNENMSFLFEAYSRHFLYRNTDLRAPTWFIDGFAQYFASSRFTDSQMLVGKAPTAITDYLNFLSSGRRHSLDYTDILEQNNSKGHNYAGKEGVRLEFEARSWILTHYMLSSSDNLKQLRSYLQLIKHDIAPTKAFEQAFGYKASELSNRLWKYRFKSAEAITLKLPELPAAEISFSSFPISADKLLLADAALKSCPSPKVGESLLQKVRNEAKKYPSSDFAQLILNRAEIHWGNAQDTLPYLTKLTQKEDSNFDAFYLLGLAQLHLAEQNQNEQKKSYLEAARHSLMRAYSINPQSAEAAYAFFKTGVLAQETPSEDVLGAAILAWRYGHEISTFARASALAYAYLGRNAEAQDTLALMTHNIREPEMAEWAKAWQARLTTGASRSEIVAEMRIEPNSRFIEWTMANEKIMQNVRMQANLEDAVNVIKAQKQSDQTPDTSGAEVKK